MNAFLTRRQFIGYSAVGGALLITNNAALAEASKTDAVRELGDGNLSPLLRIHPDNKITFYYPSPEMGQGVDTSLAALFVEELGGDMELVSVEPMPYLIKMDEDGNPAPLTVPQFAGGSTSISRNYPLLREAGAVARQLLTQAAAEHFSIPIEKVSIAKSVAINPNGQQVTFGELVELAARQALPKDFKPNLKPKADWNIIGRQRKGLQVEKIVTGQPLYGMDIDYPNAKVAMIARSPYLDGDIKSVDSKAARKLPGVHAVVELPRPPLDGDYTYLAAGVAVVADDFWTAKKARDLLKIEWDKGPHQQESSESLDKQCAELLKGKGQMVRNDGDFAKAIATAEKVVERTYKLPLVSHAQLEPQNCIAHVTKNKCTIIGPMQSPGGGSRKAAAITGLDRMSIDARYTRLGGGFGRRLSSDHVAEAVTVAKESWSPVKLIWTREDDMAHDFYRPMGHHQMIAAMDKAGKVTAWAHRLAGTQKHYRRAYSFEKPEEMFEADLYIDDFPAALVENLQNEYLPAKSGAPQGSWRAPAHTANAFVVQSFVDELASELNRDPLQLQLDMLGKTQQLEYGQHGGPLFDTGRLATVLKTAAEMANWGRAMPKCQGLGIAGHFTFGGYCAQVAELELFEDGSFRVNKIFAAVDVGIVINPDGVIAQVEGGINDGLSTAMGQQILIKDGKVVTENFDTYPMLRMADSVVEIEVQIIDSDEEPNGVGEIGLPPTAPAVANAIKAAGGPRFRNHPMVPEYQSA